VHAQIIDDVGNLVGSEHTLNLPVATNMHLTSLADGGVLAWWNAGGDGDGSANHAWSAQYIGTDGQLAGSAFSIGSNVIDIAATADGGFYVESTPYVGNNQDVVEQKFDAVPDSSGGGNPGQIQVSGGTTAIGAGNYAITGSAGLDTIAFAGAHTQYNVTANSVTGPEGTDTLSGIERIHFSDGFAVALDVNGDAGEAYRLYQAAFNRAPDLPGLGFHINDLDHGVPLWMVAEHFIDSPEFQTTYGNTDNTQFITLLYQNVLHRAPDTGGLQFHMDEFAHGESRADMLIHFSESPENQANVIGQIDNGMLYVPLA
jgi:hypothetical protein